MSTARERALEAIARHLWQEYGHVEPWDAVKNDPMNGEDGATVEQAMFGDASDIIAALESTGLVIVSRVAHRDALDLLDSEHIRIPYDLYSKLYDAISLILPALEDTNGD